MEAPGESSADQLAAEQRAKADWHRRQAKTLEDRASRTARAATTEFNMARQLDALLTSVGYHCLHDCKWPGTAKANVDHVVIGPGGAFVIDDKYYSSEVRTGTDGRVWSGRYPFEKEIDKALAQAVDVGRVLGGVVTPILAIHGSEVTAGPMVRGVHLIAARDVPGLIQRQPARLSSSELRALVAAASHGLAPAICVPRFPTRRDGAPPFGRVTRRRKPSRADKSRRPSRRQAATTLGWDLALRAGFAAAVMLGLWHFLQPEVQPAVVTDRTVHTEEFEAGDLRIHSSYKCTADGDMAHVISVTGRSMTGADRATAPEGPWTPMAVDSAGASADVTPGQSAYVQIHRTGDDGAELSSMISSVSPAGGCG